MIPLNSPTFYNSKISKTFVPFSIPELQLKNEGVFALENDFTILYVVNRTEANKFNDTSSEYVFVSKIFDTKTGHYNFNSTLPYRKELRPDGKYRPVTNYMLTYPQLTNDFLYRTDLSNILFITFILTIIIFVLPYKIIGVLSKQITKL